MFFPLQVYTGGNVMEVLEAVDDYLPEGGGKKAFDNAQELQAV